MCFLVLQAEGIQPWAVEGIRGPEDDNGEKQYEENRIKMT